jgi:hypothetical protein
MSNDHVPSLGRRKFLKGAGAAAASLPTVIASRDGAVAASPSATQLAQARPQSPWQASVGIGYQLLSLDEAAFTEALVDHMWPSDQLHPQARNSVLRPSSTTSWQAHSAREIGSTCRVRSTKASRSTAISSR